MPPLMQIDSVSVVAYDDTNVRTAIEFTEQDLIKFYKGAAKDMVRLANVHAPIEPADAANKQYVDAMVRGPAFKAGVRVAVVEPLDTVLPGTTVDGVVILEGDRILMTNQTDPVTNGIWVVGATALTRPEDFTNGSLAAGSYIFVNEGTVNKDRAYVCTTNHTDATGTLTDVVGTHPLAFALFNSSVPLNGHGLTQMPDGSIGVNVDNQTLTIKPDGTLAIKDGSITASQLAPGAISGQSLAPDSITNAALLNDSITIETTSGLTGGHVTALGETVTLAADPAVVAFQGLSNTFTATNTFTKVVAITDTTASTSQDTGALTVDGGVGINGDVYCNSSYNMSDERLKDNIMPITGALDVIESIRGCTFEWNDSVKQTDLIGQKSVGFIAQEIVAALTPSQAGMVVANVGSTDEFMAVDYPKMAPFIVEALKTVSSTVKDLKRRCEEMETEIIHLRSSKRRVVTKETPEPTIVSP
jgi:hypothetical protein